MTVHTVLVVMDEPIERDSSQQVDHKPRLQVVFGHLFGSILFHLRRRSDVGCTEVEEDIKNEDEIHKSGQND